MSYSVGFEGANTWVIWLPFAVLTTGKPVLPQFNDDNVDLLQHDPTAGGTFNPAVGHTVFEILEQFAVTNVTVTRTQFSVTVAAGKGQAEAEAVARFIESKGETLRA